MDVLETFRLYLSRDQGLEPGTVGLNYKLMRRLVRQASPLSASSLDAFIGMLIEQKRKTKYINQYINAAHYWGKAFNLPDIENYPYYEPKRRYENEYIAAVMADDEVEAFLSLPNPWPENSPYWKRYEMWTCFWQICAYHGPRMQEVAAMRRNPTQDQQSCVDFGANTVIFDGKTGPRKVPLSFVIRDHLRWYVDHLVEGEYLFPAKHPNTKKPYVGDTGWGDDFWKRISRIDGQFPGLSHRMNLKPYSLRHSAGTRWAEENWSLKKIQQALGHKRLATTEKYLHMSMKGIAEMIDNDRIALPHKHSLDIVQWLIDGLYTAGKRFRDRVLIDIRHVDQESREYVIRIKAF